MIANRSILLINQINNQFDHQILLLRPAFGDEQRERHERTVCQPFAAIGRVEDTVPVKKPEEQKGSDPLVTVNEGMVLDHKIEQVGGLFLDTRVEVPVAEALIDPSQGCFQGIVLFLSEKTRRPG